jgi:hypothetical protein
MDGSAARLAVPAKVTLKEPKDFRLIDSRKDREESR